MEMMVLWSDSAIHDLKEIKDYYTCVANLRVARKIVNAIVDKSLHLESNPNLGQAEELLIHLQKNIRYLIEGNYKIVYLVNKLDVLVLSVFDSRQNPQKLKVDI